MIIFNFDEFSVVMDGTGLDNLFQISIFYKGYYGKCAKGLCQCVVKIW